MNERIEIQRCSGHCCSSFFLPIGPDVLARRAEWHAARSMGEELPHDARLFHEGVQVAEMVECLGWFDANPVHRSLRDGAESGGFYYRCKNLSPSGDCTIYDSRPDMCRGFPDYHHGGMCEYAGCTRRLDHQLVHVPRPVDALVVTNIDIVALTARRADRRG